jgi:tRNA A-37 threonylcarbamoyl transferase component Bud32
MSAETPQNTSATEDPGDGGRGRGRLEPGRGPTFLEMAGAACRAAGARAAGFSADPEVDDAGVWIRVRNTGSAPRQQGWKLHLSATVLSAADVLCRSLPVLLAEDASFKVAASPRVLTRLNQGESGLSQIAKFVTVYPNDDEQAVRLAVALDRATRGLRGPAIPSDRALAPGSLVHYRYGGFGNRTMQLPAGEVVPAISAPDGALFPDRRLPVYRAPEWVKDPFEASGVVERPATPPPLLAGRYRLVSLLGRSPRGEVYLALDLAHARRCVLKRARSHASVDVNGHDARDRLRHEAAVLARVAATGAAPPAVYDLVEADDELWLAMEDVDGVALHSYLVHRYAEGRPVGTDEVVAWGRQLAIGLAGVHALGLVYRDLKPANVIRAADGRLRLIDFELAYDLSGSASIFGVGTRGFMSPQQAAQQRPTVADDIYGLGALLYFAATGAEPSQAPDRTNLLTRAPSLLNPGIAHDVERVLVRLLQAEPAERYASMYAVDAALARVEAATASPPAGLGAEPRVEPAAAARRRSRRLARRLGDSLCATAVAAADGPGLTWVNSHTAGLRVAYRTLDVGAAGIVLGLAELVSELHEPRHRAVLAEAARWLRTAPAPEGPPVAGLYVGEAGIGAALLRAGQVLGNVDLVEAAAARGRWVASLPLASPDLFNGAAGRLRFHLLLWDETGDAEHLAAAGRIGDWLLAAATVDEAGGRRWIFPPGMDGFSGQAFAGYAHGAAGIGDALLDLYAATGHARFREGARGAARWLSRLAAPSLVDGSGLDWPTVEGGGRRGGLWCHGATGIGRFFLHAARHELLPGAAGTAARAARMAARGTRWAGPVQCHGLAGAIELLLDVYQAEGRHEYLAEARSLARLLESFAVERDGLLVWPSDSPVEFTPAYMVGYAGVAVCLLRLSAPERLPHQLSRRGFRGGRR